MAALCNVYTEHRDRRALTDPHTQRSGRREEGGGRREEERREEGGGRREEGGGRREEGGGREDEGIRESKMAIYQDEGGMKSGEMGRSTEGRRGRGGV